MPGDKWQPARDRIEQSCQLPGVEMAGSAAAQKNGADRLRFAQNGQLSSQCFDVSVDQVILTGGDGETFQIIGSGTLVVRDGAYGVLTAYVTLIGYEVWMLKGPVDLPNL